jgi:hypothetical protein
MRAHMAEMDMAEHFGGYLYLASASAAQRRD